MQKLLYPDALYVARFCGFTLMIFLLAFSLIDAAIAAENESKANMKTCV